MKKIFSRWRNQIDNGKVNNNCEICNDTHHLQSVSAGVRVEKADIAWNGASKIQMHCKKSVKLRDAKKVPFSEKNNSIPNQLVVEVSAKYLAILRWLFKENESIFGMRLSIDESKEIAKRFEKIPIDSASPKKSDNNKLLETERNFD